VDAGPSCWCRRMYRLERMYDHTGDGYASTATETTANARERCFRAGRFQERISDHACHAGDYDATMVPQRHSQNNLTSPKRSRLKHIFNLDRSLIEA